MMIAHPSSTAFDSLSRIIPHSFHKDHTHPKNSRLESNQVWLEHHLVQFRGHGYSNRFDYSAQRCTVLPTRYEPPDLIRELKDVTRHIPSPVLLSPLRRRPMAHTSCPNHTSVHGHSQHPCWALTQGIQPNISAHFIIPFTKQLAPHRRHLRCTLPPAELWRSWFQNHTKPAAHTTGRVVARYGLFPTAQEPVLNRQCGQTLGPWLHHTGAPKHPQVTTRGTPSPHRSHKRVFPPFLLIHTKGFSLLTPKIPPKTSRMDLP